MYYIRGKVTRQAHVDIPEGTVEEEFGRRGFFGRASHLYRTHAPVEWTRIEGDLEPHAMAVTELGRAGGDYLGQRVPFLTNDDITLHFARLTAPMPYHFRNADADEVLFVHAGHGRIETDFGPLEYRPGDYLVIPRGTVQRLIPADMTALLVMESRDEVRLPDKGLLGHHALFDPAMIDVPTPEPSEVGSEQKEWELKVQRRGKLSQIFYPFDPIDTVGYKGDLTVWRINVEHIRPVASERYHLPPSAHATFITDSAVICTFLPRPLEVGDPGALRVPFYHSNIDYDEVIFYHSGEFFSRQGIGAGMVTFHPQGIHHGPQPGAIEAAKTKQRTNEVAVMVDTLRPLDVTEQGLSVSNPDYWKSWQE